MKEQKKYYYIISSLLVLLSLSFLVAIIYGLSLLSNTQTTITETKLRSEKISEVEANLRDLKKRYEAIEPEIIKIDTALPDQKNASNLITDLNLLAIESGLKLTNIQSVTVSKRGVTTKDPSLLQTIKGKYSYELPLEIKVEGSFVAFNSFVNRVENYQRILNISSVEISKKSDKEFQTDDVEAKLKITAYLKK